MDAFAINPNSLLLAGDVLLADYEEELPSAWTGSFARKQRDYDVMCALSRAARGLGEAHKCDIIIYDVGPNVGALNRTILLNCDFFATPVAADLFSLRALATVGRSLGRWIRDWETVRHLATAKDQETLLTGQPVYLGYITSAYKVSSGRIATRPHEYWEKKIAPRVRECVVQDLQKVHANLVPHTSNNLRRRWRRSAMLSSKPPSHSNATASGAAPSKPSRTVTLPLAQPHPRNLLQQCH